MIEPSSDPRYALLLEALVGYGVYMLDPEGRVSSWNAGAERLKGYASHEIHGQPYSRFFTLEDRQAGLPEQLLRRALSDGRVDAEGWRVRKDGGRFWAVVTLQCLRDDAGAVVGFAKLTRDMTAQREAQLALIESERRFRYLVDGVIDYAIYMLDPNGVIVNWNKGAERIKGYRSDEIVGRHFSAFYAEADRNAGLPAKALATALREGRFEGEGWRYRKDGSRFWALAVLDPIYDDDGRHIGYAKVTRDMSERRAAEEALAQSERQFRLLVTSVVDYAIYMLDPNGIVTNWNTGAEAIKGYRADEVVGHHVSLFYAPEDRASGAALRNLHAAMTDGRCETEGWRVRKDGSWFWANVVIHAIRDEQGGLIGFAKVTRDITEKRKAQVELEKAQQQIAKAQKMEALGQLTGGVAHDFNNILMVISGQAQMLRRKVGDNPAAQRGLDAIELSARRGEDLTRHLLSFARRQRLHTTVVPLSERLAGVGELVGASLPPTIHLSLKVPDDLWPVEVDQSEFELAMLNLAVNARDAMEGGGVLSISAENLVLSGTETSTGLRGEAVRVTVADTGSGIPDDILEHIFEPFFTTKAVNKGTGLGLSQVYGFAQQAGGDLTVASRLNEGACFSIYLPRSQAVLSEAPAAASDTAPDGPRRAEAALILVVEDNPEVAEVAVQILTELGHRVNLVQSASAALALLQEGDRPDLVFSDIVMAGDLDGLGLARRLRVEYPQLPVLLATGYSQASQTTGADFPILRKPYRAETLKRAVDALLPRVSTSPGGNLIPIDAARRARKTKTN